MVVLFLQVSITLRSSAPSTDAHRERNLVTSSQLIEISVVDNIKAR